MAEESPLGGGDGFLERLGRGLLLTECVRALGEEDANTRRAAILGLGRIGPEALAAAPDLAAILGEDPDPSLRAEAATALAALGVRALPWLMPALGADEPV